MHTSEIPIEAFMESKIDRVEEQVRLLEKRLKETVETISQFERTLNDAVNELCRQCKNERSGACDGCKWKGIRGGMNGRT